MTSNSPAWERHGQSGSQDKATCVPVSRAKKRKQGVPGQEGSVCEKGRRDRAADRTEGLSGRSTVAGAGVPAGGPPQDSGAVLGLCSPHRGCGPGAPPAHVLER